MRHSLELVAQRGYRPGVGYYVFDNAGTKVEGFYALVTWHEWSK